MKTRRDVFQAIADPTRRTILLLIASQAMTAGAIASNFEFSRPTVSNHIKILAECELVQRAQKGREIYYQLNPEKMKAVDDFLAPFRTMWDDRFNKLEAVMQKFETK